MSDVQGALPERMAKLEALRARGVDPYPASFRRTISAAELHDQFASLAPGSETGRRVAVAGRLLLVRRHGRLAFGELQDWSGRVQLFVDQARLGEEDFAAFGELDLGDWVGAEGEVITTRRGELSVRVERVVLLAKALRPFPEKWHGLRDIELRQRRRYLDLVVNEEARRTALRRIRTVEALRAAFRRRGFLEVETPMLQAQPGGALALPFVTHYQALDLDMYLRIAPELYLKRLVVGGMERVFEINRNFRNEGVSPKHLPEFTMLEAYLALADYREVMDLVEQVIVEVVEEVAGSTKLSYRGRPLDFSSPWPRVGYLAAIAEHAGLELSPSMSLPEMREQVSRLGLEVDETWGVGKVIDHAFEKLVQPALWDPTFVVDFPKAISPLARTHPGDPALAERFELVAAGLELGTGFSELNDPIEQRRRFEDQARARAAGDIEAHPIDQDYLVALEHGLPPCGGLGIGVDRLVMLLADQPNIREVILFPHMRPERD